MSKRISILLTLAAVLGFSHKADAAGFALIEQSVSNMGYAYAGGAAVAEDASTIFFNPAGITRLCGNQVVLGMQGVFPSAEFDNHGSVVFPGVGAAEVKPTNFSSPFNLTGNDGENGGMNAIVGSGYYSRQINDRFWVGLAITGPFGLATSYDDHWKGRYQGLHSGILTTDINPVIAYKINSCWSIGAGFRAFYMHAKLTSEVDYGTIASLTALTLGESQPIIQTGLNELEFLPQTQDGHVIIKGNDWGYGGNIGVLYEPRCGTRFGFNWRSQISLKIKGTEKFDRLPLLIKDPSLAGPLASFFQAIKAAGATNTGAKTHLKLPDIIQISAYHELNDCWAIMGDISWTRWNVLQKLVFKFKNTLQPDSILTLKWKNALRYSVGTSYKPQHNWILRAGLAYDESPVHGNLYQTVRLPDNNRVWLACGVGYDWSRCIHIDFGYAHLFVKERPINKSHFQLPEDFTKGGMKGKWDNQVNIAALQLVYKF